MKEVILFGFGGIVSALIYHLIESVHQIIPVSLVNIANYTDNITEATQLTCRVPDNYAGQKVNSSLGYRGSPHREVVSGTYIINPCSFLLINNIVVGKAAKFLVKFLLQ